MLKKDLLALFAVALVSLPLTAVPQSHDQLVERYTGLAGSKQNAESLVRGLREGDTVTLSRWTGSVMLFPPTGKLGYGNVDHALTLAEASLAKHGITDPTPAELATALMGGNVVTPRSGTVALDGVLRMRAEGKGWGQIAQSYGVKLGEVKHFAKAEGAPKAKTVGKANHVAKLEPVSRRPDTPERPQKPEKTR
jgi:hypothetical protein